MGQKLAENVKIENETFGKIFKHCGTTMVPICSLSFLASTHGHICLVITHFTLSLPLKLLERNTLDQCVKQRPEEGKNRDARTYTIGIEKCWLRSTQHSSLLIWGDDIY